MKSFCRLLSVTGRFCKRKRRFTVVIVLVTLFPLLKSIIIDQRGRAIPESRHVYSTIYPEIYTRNERSDVKILLWTNFFGSDNWFHKFKGDTCLLNCSLTLNKGELESADVVVFHLADILWQGIYTNGLDWFTWPNYRRKNQIWVLFNLEPLTMLWGDLGAFQDVFNWTLSYSRDTDISTPYRRFRTLNRTEMYLRQTNLSKVNYFAEKNKTGAFWMVSNCYDDARRYKIAGVLQKYINVDIYGHCGTPCPHNVKCTHEAGYKFYLALENSDCREYISEKFWESLFRRQIPIVAWKFPEQQRRLVPPGSYINVYDFPDLLSAGAYIQQVDRNESLYNSYFKWTLSTDVYGETPGFCQICEKVKNGGFQHKSYHDLNSWFLTDTCRPASLLGFFGRVIDRKWFNLWN